MIAPAAPMVIAEGGVNHNGDLGRALEMVAVAADAGAEYIKFQAFSAAELVAAGAGTAAYQAANTGEADQAALLRGLELSVDAFAEVAAACRAHGVGFLCTAFDAEAIDVLVGLGMDRVKVASGELTNLPTLRRFAALGLPILLSTGMATLDEVGVAVDTLRSAGAADITLLHCTSLYPAAPESLNLRAMATMAEAFGLPVGYSDHSLGSHAAVAAVALGAVVIEKHFTLDRTLPGPDHKASLEPGELVAMVRKLRETAVMLGDGTKKPAPGEAETAALVRRSWHARRDLPAGTVVAAADVALKRPADGLPPADSPIGRTLCVAVRADAPVRAADIVNGGAGAGA